MSSPAPTDMRTLVAACAAITVFGFAFGMTYPLLSLILESRGVSSDMIGINSAMMPIGILLFSPMIPYAAKRFGARRVSHTALFLFIFVASLQVYFAFQPDETLWQFVPLMAVNMMLLGFIGSNFGAIAMNPFFSIAGAASSAHGFVRMTTASLLGGAIGYAFDGTARPLALALLAMAVIAIGAGNVAAGRNEIAAQPSN